MEDLIIYGAGRLGTSASIYYSASNILCFVDNDKTIWGTSILGIPVYSPDAIKNFNGRIVVAVAMDAEKIANNLLKKGKNVSIFRIDEERVVLDETYRHDMRNAISLHFGGGLGNQMFVYALYRALECAGKNVYGVIDHRIGMREYVLTKAFPHTNVRQCSVGEEKEIYKYAYKERKNYLYFCENIEEGIQKKANDFLLSVDCGVILGMHQTYFFANMVRDILLQDFKLDSSFVTEQEIVRRIVHMDNTVSVHVRRGDYLTKRGQRLYGGICTEEYYWNAMKYIREKTDHPIFIFFSNDIEWVKNNYKIEGAIYVSPDMYEEKSGYKDWYDMYLMSLCKHNIIANSTFSWWGAWLNRNEDRIVIAPKRWINVFDYQDIYPMDWIKVKGDGNDS